MFEPNPRQPYPLQLLAVARHAGPDNPAFSLMEKALAGVSARDMYDLQEKYKMELAEFRVGPLKFLDVPYWTYNKAQLARTLGLDASPPPSILDLGTGGGHFPRVCNHLGHSTVSIDVEMPLYEDICRVLDVRRTISSVEPETALPNFGQKFDLITAIAINFHRIEHRIRYWSIGQWRFLFNDLISNQLRFPWSDPF